MPKTSMSTPLNAPMRPTRRRRREPAKRAKLTGLVVVVAAIFAATAFNLPVWGVAALGVILGFVLGVVFS